MPAPTNAEIAALIAAREKKLDQVKAAFGHLKYVEDKGEAGVEYEAGELQAAISDFNTKALAAVVAEKAVVVAIAQAEGLV